MKKDEGTEATNEVRNEAWLGSAIFGSPYSKREEATSHSNSQKDVTFLSESYEIRSK